MSLELRASSIFNSQSSIFNFFQHSLAMLFMLVDHIDQQGIQHGDFKHEVEPRQIDYAA